MRTFDLAPLYRSTVGFDRLFSMLDGFEAAPGYPPYNIERTGDNAYRISVAVAGFGENELSIEAKENTLTIKGEKQAKNDSNGGEVLYQGIAARAFERVFQLADYVQVKGAALENGLLHVDLVREIPRRRSRARSRSGTVSPKWSKPRLPEPSAQSEERPGFPGRFRCPQSRLGLAEPVLLYSSIDAAAGVGRRVGRPGGFVLIARRTRWLLRRWRWRCPRCGLGIRCIGCGELGPRSRQRRRTVAGSAAAPAPGAVAGAGVRRKAFGARRRRHPRRIRAVALRNHGNRPRRAAVGRPHQRHGVTRRHQRYHLDDAPALRIDDDPDLFTGRIDRAQRVSRALAHRTTHGLKSGRSARW